MKKIILSLTLLASVSSFAESTMFLDVPSYTYTQEFKNSDINFDKAAEIFKCAKAIASKRVELENKGIVILEIKTCAVSSYGVPPYDSVVTGRIKFIK